MKVLVYISDVTNPEESREESYHVEEDTNLLLFGLTLVNNWNATLREKDIPRILISIKKCGDKHPHIYTQTMMRYVLLI